MAESELHRYYVSAIVTFIEENYCIVDKRLIATAIFDNAITPPNINGFVPDVFFHLPTTGQTIIGEAKSSGDISTNRSISQITAFLRYCDSIKGSIVIAVPWTERATAINIIKNINKRHNLDVQFIVLEFLPWSI